MSGMEWVKLKTNIFENRKIRYLLSMNSGEQATLLYIRLLCLAGQYGTTGEIMLCDGVPYNAKMLADVFDYGNDGSGESFIQTVLDTLVKLDLLEFDGERYTIASWEEHQAVDKLEKQREQTRLRVQKHRAKQACNVTCNADVTHGNANVTQQSKSKSKSKEITPKGVTKKSAFGSCSNVMLTDEELAKLKEKFSDWQDRIERLSLYVASTGKRYKSHYATILNWARKDQQSAPKQRVYTDDWGD